MQTLSDLLALYEGNTDDSLDIRKNIELFMAVFRLLWTAGS